MLPREDFELGSRWGWVVARGVVAILFGLLAFARPAAMTLTLVMLFAAYAFAGGVMAIITAARRGRAGSSWSMLLLDGVLGIAVAVAAILWPASMAVAFIWVIGVWALVSGLLEIGTAINLRKVIDHEWALGLAGAATVIIGLVMLAKPLIGGLAIVWWLGAYAMAFGVLMVVLGFRLRSYQHTYLGRGRRLPSDQLPQMG
jgi:uncharacterized membrane protein HdeD (DUF308 family)